MRLLWLPERLRAWGLEVVEVEGWQWRGKAFVQAPTVAVGHHTATSAAAFGDLPTLGILVRGRSDLPGPLCQVGLSRSGVAHVVASGKANHAGKGAWRGITSSAATVGCEVEHPGTGSWSKTQMDAFDRVMAALLDGLGQSAGHYCGHREWATPAGRKVDPGGVDLERQRGRIARLLLTGSTVPNLKVDDPPTPPAPIPEALVFELLETTDTRRLYAFSALGVSHIPSMDALDAMVRCGAFGPEAPVESRKVSQADIDAVNGVLA